MRPRRDVEIKLIAEALLEKSARDRSPNASFDVLLENLYEACDWRSRSKKGFLELRDRIEEELKQRKRLQPVLRDDRRPLIADP
jgi:hypothetical protein